MPIMVLTLPDYRLESREKETGLQLFGHFGGHVGIGPDILHVVEIFQLLTVDDYKSDLSLPQVVVNLPSASTARAFSMLALTSSAVRATLHILNSSMTPLKKLPLP